jgi:hypothetical protein
MTARKLDLAIALLFVASIAQLSAGPSFASGSRLSVMKTEHFDIVFSEASKRSALLLSAFAESVYDEVSGKLGRHLAHRLPVAITEETGQFNGVTEAWPYFHIILYAAPLDQAWTVYGDNLRGLFLHELTHAISLDSKAPWAEFLSGIFGSWVMPTYLTAPAFMVEGVTVSFESADGLTGRASDPLVKERLRQDIRENRFKSPLEASGIYDGYPYADIYYEYGGLFSAYLQKAYGIEKYAELWKAMGSLPLRVSLDPYKMLFYELFAGVYGMPIEKAWADFRDSLELRGLVDPPEPLGPKPFGPAGLAQVSGALAGDGSSLYWVDARTRRGIRTEIATGRSEALFDAGSSDEVCDLSTSRDELLVSRTVALPDGRGRQEAISYKLGERRFLPRTRVEGLREPRFFRGGLLGLRSRGTEADLVLLREAEPELVLLRGSSGLRYGSPAVLDEARVALIVAMGGTRSIGLLEVDSGRLSLVRPEGADAELLAYARSLSASEGRLYFDYDSDDRFYKLGLLELSGGEPSIRVETLDYSGGVFRPLVAGGRVRYVARFSEGDRLYSYPGEAASIGTRKIACSLEPLDPSVPAQAEDLEIDRIGADALASIRPYRGLAYANPFRMWFLYPDLQNLGQSTRIMSSFWLQDPIDENYAILTAGYDMAHPFADATLSWTTLSLPLALSGTVADTLVYRSEGAPQRQIYATLSADLSLPSYPSDRGLSLGLRATGLSRSEGSSASPYDWGRTGYGFPLSARVAWNGIVSLARDRNGRGLAFEAFQYLDAASLAEKTEAHLAASYDRFPVRLDLWGARASSSLLRLDGTSDTFLRDQRPAYFEYAGLRTGEAPWLVQGALSLGLANQAIRSALLHAYLNRVVVELGLRGAWFRDEALASAFARASLDIGAAAGMAAGVLRFYAEGYTLLTEAEPLRSWGFRVGVSTSADAMGRLGARGR